MKDISILEKKLGVFFKNKKLLQQALTHRSYLNENPNFRLPHNERLEFLGDAVLELIVTKYLYLHYDNPEGELTSWRAALVNAQMLSRIASDLGINDFLFLSHGEAKDKGRGRQYILANTMEAIIGAIFLDQGIKAASNFVRRHIISKLPWILKNKLYKDAKSQFQEEAQDRLAITPTYEILQEWGPDHARKFRVGVFLGKEKVAEGEGNSKQEAQRKAAQTALKKKNWG